MATQTELEALRMVSMARLAWAPPLTAAQAGEIVIRMADDIKRERRQKRLEDVIIATASDRLASPISD